MIEVTNKTRMDFLRNQIGLIDDVLVERMKSDNECTGYTMNYTPIKFKSDTDLCGKTVSVKIIGVEDDFCIGELC